MWAVVPVKDMSDAKARLAPVLRPAERHALFRAMLEDVLAALAAVTGLAGIALVTRDGEARALARRHGFRVIDEDRNLGHRAAVARAAGRLSAEGADGLLQVPGDVPLATADELATVLARHGVAPALTLVPSRDRLGSNCLAVSPPEAIPFLFGDVSFEPHLAAARARGIAPTVLDLPGLGLDIDTPEDLSELLAHPVTTRAQRYLHESGVARRLAAPSVLQPAAVDAAIGG